MTKYRVTLEDNNGVNHWIGAPDNLNSCVQLAALLFAESQDHETRKSVCRKAACVNIQYTDNGEDWDCLGSFYR